MARALGAALLAAALAACQLAAPSLTLLFLGRSPAASMGGHSWAPDPDSSRIVAFDGTLRVAKVFTSARLATPIRYVPPGADRPVQGTWTILFAAIWAEQTTPT